MKQPTPSYRYDDQPTQLEPVPKADMTPRLWRRVAKAYGVTVAQLAECRRMKLTVGGYRARGLDRESV